MAEVTIGVSYAIDESRRSQELPQSKNAVAFSQQQAGILKIGRTIQKWMRNSLVCMIRKGISASVA